MLSRAAARLARNLYYALDEQGGGDFFMITKQDVIDVVSDITEKYHNRLLGSHSALDVCDGARDDGEKHHYVSGRDYGDVLSTTTSR